MAQKQGLHRLEPAEQVGGSAPAFHEDRQPAASAGSQRAEQDTRAFMEEEGTTTSPLGMALQEAYRGVDGSGEVAGLLVVKVFPGTPAAQTGLHNPHTGVNTAISGAALVASIFFPPAMLAAALVNGSHVGESYDLIIGVDSERTCNYLDFSDRMRLARPGEVVYLSISRNGRRMQIPVRVPSSG